MQYQILKMKIFQKVIIIKSKIITLMKTLIQEVHGEKVIVILKLMEKIKIMKKLEVYQEERMNIQVSQKNTKINNILEIWSILKKYFYQE